MASPTEKRPRHYAAEIIALHTGAEREAALEKVPPEFRPIVETHVRNHFALRRTRKAAQ